jgi:triosephosphate isomerase
MAPSPTARIPIVGGNWKMNTDLATGLALAGEVAAGCADLLDACEVVVFPPFPYLQAVEDVLGRAAGARPALGAQDVYHQPDGAFTGEVSTGMLLDLGVTTVLAGHSERRHVIGEDDDLVASKLRAALAGGLSAVLCVGETMEQREAGRTRDVNLDQLSRGLDGVDGADMDRVVIAYEPVWAIGTGHTATPDDAEAVHQLLRDRLAELYDETIAAATRIQYGGSVKPDNAASLIERENIDGFLVGGASLKAGAFIDIVRAAATRPSPAPQREARNA